MLTQCELDVQDFLSAVSNTGMCWPRQSLHLQLKLRLNASLGMDFPICAVCSL